MATILTKEDKNICEQISNGDDSIHKRRAQALLLIDEGQVQSEAAARTDLSVGQVRYALARFKVLGISLFPNELIIEKELKIIEPVIVEETVETSLNDKVEIEYSEKPKKEKKKKNKKEESSKKSQKKKRKKEKSKKKGDSKKKSKKEKK